MKKKAGKSPGRPSADCGKDGPQTTAKPGRSADASRLAASRIQKSEIRGQSFKASPKRRFLKYLIMRAIQALPRLIFREIKAGHRLPAPPPGTDLLPWRSPARPPLGAGPRRLRRRAREASRGSARALSRGFRAGFHPPSSLYIHPAAPV